MGIVGCYMTAKRLEIVELHTAHPGIPASVEGFYAVAAAVCLQRHHVSPCAVGVALEDDKGAYDAAWRKPTEHELRSFQDDTDRTCFGAYTVALAAAAAHLGHKAVGRAGTSTGADWLIIPVEDEVDEWYLENPRLTRLEVTGMDHADPTSERRRLQGKLRQARGGKSDLPALAAVVVFSSPTVLFARVS